MTATLAYADVPTAWMPEESVRDHMGQPLPPNRDFFASPPAEIGPITNAFSALLVAMQRADIRDVRLAGGVLTFHHHDAKWYSSAGTYRLQYGQLANARVFLLLLDKLMGYRFAG
jgi:hypothetical protein